MPINIDFRGVMLFQCVKADGGPLDRILLPNGDTDSSWPQEGKHPDGSNARTHFAGLVLERKGALDVIHVPLKDTTVEIVVDGATDGPRVNLSGLPKLRPATYGKGGGVNPRLATALITVRGGRLFGFPSLDPTKFKSKSFVNEPVDFHGARLEAETSAKIVIQKHNHEPLTLEINPGDEVAVYNYEDRYPSMDDLRHMGRCKYNDVTRDDDFVWLYSLLDAWNKNDYDHPAPMVICKTNPSPPPGKIIVDATTITVFTCFPAVWDDSTG